jgi:hypothetical protein
MKAGEAESNPLLLAPAYADTTICQKVQNPHDVHWMGSGGLSQCLTWNGSEPAKSFHMMILP